MQPEQEQNQPLNHQPGQPQPAVPVSPLAAPTATPNPAPMSAAKKSKVPLLIIVIVILLVGGVAAALLLNNKNTQKTGSATKTNLSDSNSAATPATKATPEEIATKFVQAVQSGDKALADSLLAPATKVSIKNTTGSESYYDYCKSDQFCGSLKWVKLDTAAVTVTDGKLEDSSGTAAKIVNFSVVTISGKSKSTNTLKVSLTPNGESWYVADVTQSTNSDSDYTN